MIVPYALWALIATCAPSVHPQTMAAVVSVESSGDPWAIGDNDAHRSYHPPTYGAAVSIAYTLLAQGHNLDLGLGQVNSIHLREYGTTPESLLQPCANLRVASDILYKDWRNAESRFGATRLALDRAIGAYNTGSLFAGEQYRSRVVDAASTLVFQPSPYYPRARPDATRVADRSDKQARPASGTDIPLR